MKSIKMNGLHSQMHKSLGNKKNRIWRTGRAMHAVLRPFYFSVIRTGVNFVPVSRRNRAEVARPIYIANKSVLNASD